MWLRLVRFGFFLLYNHFAWTYDLVSWVVSLGEWRAWTNAGISHLPKHPTQPTHVLEIAHGPGHMLLALKKAGFDVVGLDLSPFMGRQAQRRLQKAGLSVPLVQGDVSRLPFNAGIFHHVYSTFPTDFIIAPTTLQAVHRVLQPNGRFVIIPVAQLKGANILVRFLEWLYVITGQRQQPPTTSQHQLANHNPLIIQLQNAGFSVSSEQVNLNRSLVTVVIADKID
jgi:ubiquinone/menaquinone biosynthesis C-methylase UbiE